MKKKSKWLGLAAVSLALTTSLSACGSGSGDTGTSGDIPAKNAASQSGPFKLGSEPVNFTMYPNYDWLTLEPWGQDPQTQWITDNLKVTVTPIQSGGAAKQKFSTMLATDDLPDVILMDRGSDVEKLRQAGKLVALDDYYNKYPNLKKWMGEETINMLRSSDGKIYQVPNWYTTSANGNGGYLINRKVYKELGSPKLESFDDLYNYLKQVKAKYPDMIPFETDIEGQGVQIMTSGFKEGFAPSWIGERGVPSGDKFTSLFTDPVFNETMKFASKLFREKLITQDTLTQKREQVDEKLANGRVAVYSAYSVLEPKVMDANTLLRAKDPDNGYEVIWPLHKDGVDKTKVYPNSYNRLGWNVNVITTTAKNPEGIFAYMDWLTSPEGMSTMYFGPKGKYWNEMDSNQYPVLTDKWFNTSQEIKDKEKLGGYAYVGNTTYLDTMKMANDKKMKPEQRRWDNTQQANVTWKTSQDLTPFINLDPASDSEEGIAKTAVDDIYKKYFAQALFAQSDAEVDTILKKANDEAMSQGYQKLLDYKTAQWKKNLEQMQAK
ncbi:ABC-type glycerol-3-phosphate transport system substrate-binding protein [Paenibacillus rhizosphaerae]|uniref:ABC-type glycerol-3-phosphate transport system substrate-binding protein n=1 Tax=Paenibacillus rhizosphaerae TaxID=297318 RepID=A0A839TU82_9BACL|nr:extracellular solute-binding protein [Paenibacillus rhizosphaerae]MBB3128839.1 ABC-type glycerol-3-phosphate transport system substrate-binding protein [Paenibacillus rhizosphaerae]